MLSLQKTAKTPGPRRFDLYEDRRPLTNFDLLNLLVPHSHVQLPCILTLESRAKVKLTLRRPVRPTTSWEQPMADTPKETVLAVGPFQVLRKRGEVNRKGGRSRK
jgi:hypothetical protein